MDKKSLLIGSVSVDKLPNGDGNQGHIKTIPVMSRITKKYGNFGLFVGVHRPTWQGKFPTVRIFWDDDKDELVLYTDSKNPTPKEDLHAVESWFSLVFDNASLLASWDADCQKFLSLVDTTSLLKSPLPADLNSDESSPSSSSTKDQNPAPSAAQTQEVSPAPQQQQGFLPTAYQQNDLESACQLESLDHNTPALYPTLSPNTGIPPGTQIVGGHVSTNNNKRQAIVYRSPQTTATSSPNVQLDDTNLHKYPQTDQQQQYTADFSTPMPNDTRLPGIIESGPQLANTTTLSNTSIAGDSTMANTTSGGEAHKNFGQNGDSGPSIITSIGAPTDATIVTTLPPGAIVENAPFDADEIDLSVLNNNNTTTPAQSSSAVSFTTTVTTNGGYQSHNNNHNNNTMHTTNAPHFSHTNADYRAQQQQNRAVDYPPVRQLLKFKTSSYSTVPSDKVESLTVSWLKRRPFDDLVSQALHVTQFFNSYLHSHKYVLLYAIEHMTGCIIIPKHHETEGGKVTPAAGNNTLTSTGNPLNTGKVTEFLFIGSSGQVCSALDHVTYLYNLQNVDYAGQTDEQLKNSMFGPNPVRHEYLVNNNFVETHLDSHQLFLRLIQLRCRVFLSYQRRSNKLIIIGQHEDLVQAAYQDFEAVCKNALQYEKSFNKVYTTRRCVSDIFIPYIDAQAPRGGEVQNSDATTTRPRNDHYLKHSDIYIIVSPAHVIVPLLTTTEYLDDVKDIILQSLSNPTQSRALNGARGERYPFEFFAAPFQASPGNCMLIFRSLYAPHEFTNVGKTRQRLDDYFTQLSSKVGGSTELPAIVDSGNNPTYQTQQQQPQQQQQQQTIQSVPAYNQLSTTHAYQPMTTTTTTSTPAQYIATPQQHMMYTTVPGSAYGTSSTIASLPPSSIQASLDPHYYYSNDATLLGQPQPTITSYQPYAPPGHTIQIVDGNGISTTAPTGLEYFHPLDLNYYSYGTPAPGTTTYASTPQANMTNSYDIVTSSAQPQAQQQQQPQQQQPQQQQQKLVLAPPRPAAHQQPVYESYDFSSYPTSNPAPQQQQQQQQIQTSQRVLNSGATAYQPQGIQQQQQQQQQQTTSRLNIQTASGSRR